MQSPVIFFHARSAQKFSIKVCLKNFVQGLVDRYAVSKQGSMCRLKISGQGPVENFRAGSVQLFPAQAPPPHPKPGADPVISDGTAGGGV